MRGSADLAKEASDLWLAATSELSDSSLGEPVLVPVKDHLAELGAPLADQLIRTR
jgi:hypothetical protein